MTKGIDTTSQTWRFIQQFAESEIATQRARNDSLALDAIATAELRGRIAAMKSLLALGSPAPEMKADVGDY